MSLGIAKFAKALSHKLHAGQYRNDGKTPYTVHTDYVGDNAPNYLSWGFEDSQITPRNIEIAQAVGYLHDVIEDVLGSKEKLMALREDPISEHDWRIIVDAVNRMSREDKGVPVLQYLDGIKGNIFSMCGKFADLDHNLSDLKPGNLRDKYHLCQAYLRAYP